MTIPEFLAHLPASGDLPIPVITSRKDTGAPAFGSVRGDVVLHLLQTGGCGVCGRPLERGDIHFASRIYDLLQGRAGSEPAMHRACCEASLRMCPMLRGERRTYRGYENHPDAQEPLWWYIVACDWYTFEEVLAGPGQPAGAFVYPTGLAAITPVGPAEPYLITGDEAAQLHATLGGRYPILPPALPGPGQ